MTKSEFAPETTGRIGRWLLGSLLFAMALCAVGPVVGDATVVVRGRTIWLQGQTWDGLTFYPSPDGTLVLIDMDGNILNQWFNPDMDGGRLSTAEPILSTPGHVLAKKNPPGSGGAPPRGGSLMELDWDGNLVWEYDPPETLGKGEMANTVELHHDQHRLDNGNTLVLCEIDIIVPEISDLIRRDPCILEVTPDKEIVFQWHLFEHWDQLELSDEAKDLIANEPKRDYAHANTIEVLPPNSHADSRFDEGNLLLSLRSMNMILVIDRDTGDIVWKVKDRTIGQHYPNMIDEGLPGAGNILVFDNGGYYGYPKQGRMYSRVAEIDPVQEDLVRVITAEHLHYALEMLSSISMGSAQRLPNGNTLLTEPASGRIIEVNATDDRIVWEYVTPLKFVREEDDFITINRYVYRAYRIAPTWVP